MGKRLNRQFTKEAHEEMNISIPLIGNLIPVGGGKDSAVSLEVLKDEKKKNTCYVINIKEVEDLTETYY